MLSLVLTVLRSPVLLATLAAGAVVLGSVSPASAQSWGCYDPQPGHPTSAEKSAYVSEIVAYAQEAEATYGVPAAAITAMAANEGGYGWTRVAINANNLFGWKWYSSQSAGGRPYYTLSCQPSWDPNNKYVAFSTRREGVLFVASKLAGLSWYQPVTRRYQDDIAAGVDTITAVNRWVAGIQQGGYNPYPEYVTTTRKYLNNYMSPSLTYSATYNLYQYSPAGEDVWIAIDAPASGGTVSGSVPFLASTGGGAVTEVRFFSRAAGAADWYALGTDAGVPYGITWATDPWVPDGSYELKAEAWNGATRKATGVIDVVVVNDAVALVAPGYGATVGGVVSLQAHATGSIDSVRFYSRAAGAGDWYSLGVDAGAPFSASWHTDPWVPDGAYELMAEGYAGSTLVSVHAIEVTVQN